MWWALRDFPLGRLAMLVPLVCMLAACIQQPAHRDQGTYARVRTWHPVLSVDGQPPEDAYALELSPGVHEFEVLYETFRMNHLCRFELEAIGGYSYDVVDHSNPQPLVLYRWKRANGAWAERLNPQAPSKCEEISR